MTWPAAGRQRHHGEELAFWEWAIVETLRHSGVRIEELPELTHLSIRQYRRPNGEVIALLVIAPSKTDRERVIPMSAELFAVIAAIIRRHLHRQPAIPLLPRYDKHERAEQADAFLVPAEARHIASGPVHPDHPAHAAAALPRPAQTRPEFAGLTFTAHDFRRLFTTDLVNNGLPIHIGAALLGHTSLANDPRLRRGLQRRPRTPLPGIPRPATPARPADEYRPPTEAEWTGFEEHFDKRKVELGTCGRPYGTPCQHELACIRCPDLQVEPKMLARLDEIEADLLARRNAPRPRDGAARSRDIDLTLTFLRQKRAQTRRLARIAPTDLGMPSVLSAKSP